MFFAEKKLLILPKSNLLICVTFQGAPNSQNYLEKNIKAGGFTPTDFKTYCKATVDKTVWWSLRRQVARRSGVGSLEINLHRHGSSILDEEDQDRSLGEELSPLASGVGTTG